MSRLKLQLAFISVSIFALILSSQLPVQSDESSDRNGRQSAPTASYRSRTSTHKVIVYAHEQEVRDRILAEGGSLVEDYGSFWLMKAPTALADDITTHASSSLSIRDDMNAILLRAGAFDTTEGEPVALRLQDDAEPAEKQLYLIQMVGPVKQEWFDEIQASSEILSYVPNNAYLVRATPDQVDRINGMRSSGDGFIQWSGAYRPGYKIAPEIKLDSDQPIIATVQLASSEGTQIDTDRLQAVTGGHLIGEPTSVLGFTNVRISIDPQRVPEIARMSNVVWIEPWSEPQLLDERQGLIISGNFTGSAGLGAPGYLSWLQSQNLTSTPDFVVDVADSGIDQGLLDPAILHRDFLNEAGLARIIYARLLGANIEDGSSNDTGGHGTINAAIVGGYNNVQAFPFVDSQGYSLGLGVHPFVKLGVSKIFNPDFTDPDIVDMVDRMYRDGARISSNSWGAYNNGYTTESQLYDSLVRDARRNDPGNQELTVVFASGNRGAGGNLATPATAKNVLTVGASENLRPSGLDGCGVGADGADDIMSLINFSSAGPAIDGRFKPEIVAPGTHIQGAQSQDRAYLGNGVCGPRNFPTGQSFYTWSSGTSHSTPAVAGAAALLRQFFQNSTGRAPSPAMIKAFLTNSTTYLTGFNAGDSLPGVNQGWGLLDMGRALDGTPRNLIDQTQVLEGSGASLTIQTEVFDPTKPLRVTLAWTDAPGSPFANPAVNDLDLQVEINGTTYLGNRFAGSVSTAGSVADKLNNVESVWLDAGVTGEITVRVIAANITGDGVPGNADLTDQDFALVIYNARSDDSGGPVDSPPAVNLTAPVGGERLMVGNLVSILWDASDDNGIQSQRVEFSPDGGTSFDVIANLNGSARRFDWRIPSVPTIRGRIRVTALDGVNLPAASTSAFDFEIVAGPPDISPPTVSLLSPDKGSVIGGGTTTTIMWREGDNVGVITRKIELSLDGGRTFQEVASITAPSSGNQQSFEWQVPVALSSDGGKIRVTVFDGANNSTSVMSEGKFEIWALPIITDAAFLTKATNGKDELQVFGRKFRKGDTQIFVDGRKMKKVKFKEKCDDADGTCKKVSTQDKKINKWVKELSTVLIEVKIPTTGQVSPAFEWKRRRPKN